ncbi:hypothetical protein GBL98_11040 [Yersinia pseudotuberculosis]|nr:hypothetical protein [Yersinia pseudotuberculosis]OVY81147.1 hypothetical protein BFI52_17940 [Yersinia pestis subsp. microtus]PRH52530.1 hypothetical protein C6P90_18820 [Yersinia pestis]MBO1606749.1 hypothetical protein [Yersinia pseudotuberculosis]MBO1611003.1 hypothetical protein [Yersinia pseudotuberculosis]
MLAERGAISQMLLQDQAPYLQGQCQYFPIRAPLSRATLKIPLWLNHPSSLIPHPSSLIPHPFACHYVNKSLRYVLFFQINNTLGTGYR